MQPIKIGMVGAGFVAHFHARALRSVRNVEIAGVVSPNRAGKLAEQVQAWGLGEGKVYPTIAEMANHVDAIALYAPNHLRVEMTEQIVDAVKKGAPLKGVIFEKPLARNVQEARRIVELVEGAGLLSAYFENQIHMKPIQAQRAQLEPVQRAMGPLMLVRSAEEHGGPHEAWFWDPVRQGGGTLNDMGCHSIAGAWYLLTPIGKPLTFMQPVSVSCEVGLLKWGQPYWREKLLRERGVDYSKTPAEDYASAVFTFRNPETGQLVKANIQNSWMYDKQGLRLMMDGMGPGYAFEINTLRSLLEIFIGDAAAQGAADAELALEKSTATRGLLAVQYNEPDLYGYTDENEDMARSFLAGRNGMLPVRYGLEIERLVMAAYLAAEKHQTLDLTDPAVQQELETYVPLIQQGRGAEVLFR